MPRFVNIQPTWAWTKPRSAPSAPSPWPTCGECGIARLVGERVVLAVVGHPLRERPLHRHAAEDRERRLHRGARLEAPVREVAVEADRRPEGADDVHAGEDREVAPVEARRPRGGPSPRAGRAAGTTTATSVTTWLIRLVRSRTDAWRSPRAPSARQSSRLASAVRRVRFAVQRPRRRTGLDNRFATPANTVDADRGRR